jgi:hypothetical protein
MVLPIGVDTTWSAREAWQLSQETNFDFMILHCAMCHVRPRNRYHREQKWERIPNFVAVDCQVWESDLYRQKSKVEAAVPCAPD